MCRRIFSDIKERCDCSPTNTGRDTKNVPEKFMKIIKGYLILLSGLAVLSLGFSLILEAGFGNDTISVLSEGIARQTGLTIGKGSQIINLLAVAAVLFIDYKLIKAGTVIMAFSIGFLLDFFLGLIPTTDITAVRIALLIGGVLLAGTGIGITVISGKGASPVDSLMLAINRRFNVSITVSRIVLDAALTATGWILGGRAGIATLICVVSIGPIVEFTVAKIQLTPGSNKVLRNI